VRRSDGKDLAHAVGEVFMSARTIGVSVALAALIVRLTLAYWFGFPAFRAFGYMAQQLIEAYAPSSQAEMEGARARGKALSAINALTTGDIQRRLDEERQWQRKTLVETYDRVGSHNVRWDDTARQGLELAAQVWASHPSRPGDASERVGTLLGAAVAAGCDDPLVKYVHSRFDDWYGRDVEAMRELVDATEQLQRSRYPVFRKALALMMTASNMESLARSKIETTKNAYAVTQRRELVDRAMALLPDVLPDRGIPDLQIRTLIEKIVDTRKGLGIDRLEAYQAIEPMLIKFRGGGDTVLPLIKGRVLHAYAWDARGHEYINQVSEENRRLFIERLEGANLALTSAIINGSNDHEIPTQMMSVALGLNLDDREQTEWFEAARRIAPGSYEPYSSRLVALLPRWGGSDEALLEFGRTALARKEWGSRASFALVDAHDWIAKGPPKKTDYFERPVVCADMKSVYEPYLAQFPDAAQDRGRYVGRLIACRAWEDADAQLTRLGDRAVMSVFGGRDKYDAQRSLVARHIASRVGAD
jgi:hypothetical protein